MAWMILPERNSSNKTQCGLKQPNIGQPIHRNVFSRAQCSSPPISLLRLTIPDGSFTALVLFASLIQTMALHVLLRLLVAFTLSFSDTSGQRRSPTKTCHNGMVHADCIDFCPPSCQLPHEEGGCLSPCISGCECPLDTWYDQIADYCVEYGECSNGGQK